MLSFLQSWLQFIFIFLMKFSKSLWFTESLSWPSAINLQVLCRRFQSWELRFWCFQISGCPSLLILIACPTLLFWPVREPSYYKSATKVKAPSFNVCSVFRFTHFSPHSVLLPVRITSISYNYNSISGIKLPAFILCTVARVQSSLFSVTQSPHRLALSSPCSCLSFQVQ